MLRVVDREESEDAGLRQATLARENFGLLERENLGRVKELRRAGIKDDEDGVAPGGGQRGESGDKSGVGRICQGEVEP